jgi:hypothetical protein
VVRHDETLPLADHPVCGAREAQARQRAALIKVGFAAVFLMPQPPLLYQEGSCLPFSPRPLRMCGQTRAKARDYMEAALAAESN